MITSQRLDLRDFSMLIALVAISLCFWLADPAFLSARNLSQLSIEVAATAVLALGMLLIIVPGHIDLSVGSGLGLMAASPRCWWCSRASRRRRRWPAPCCPACCCTPPWGR
jgi:ABC-type xylose transport system permease subunit